MCGIAINVLIGIFQLSFTGFRDALITPRPKSLDSGAQYFQQRGDHPGCSGTAKVHDAAQRHGIQHLSYGFTAGNLAAACVAAGQGIARLCQHLLDDGSCAIILGKLADGGVFVNHERAAARGAEPHAERCVDIPAGMAQ